jgi:hypothetical protein
MVHLQPSPSNQNAGLNEVKVSSLAYKYLILNEKIVLVGGEGGIRTPDTVARMPHFECGAFNHSATSPSH